VKKKGKKREKKKGKEKERYTYIREIDLCPSHAKQMSTDGIKRERERESMRIEDEYIYRGGTHPVSTDN